MNVYLDSSALVKCYVNEVGTLAVMQLLSNAKVSATAVISRAEVGAAFARAVRVGALLEDEARAALKRFEEDWMNLVRIQVTEPLVALATSLAWKRKLRGYDAIHLAAAIFWREAFQEPVTVATYDRELWMAVVEEGLLPFPHSL